MPSENNRDGSGPKETFTGRDIVYREGAVGLLDVQRAADALLRQGRKPSVAAIREHLGGGSPNTITPLLAKYWEKLGSRLGDGPESLERVPEALARVTELLKGAGLPSAVDPTRGFDHGVFVPLKVAFPEAKIPVVTLSLAASLDPALHLAAGRALAALRDEGVLIVASGMSFHNLRAYMQPATRDRARAFDAWLTRAVEAPSSERDALLANWREAPFAAFAHPREEHLIPLMVAAGAGLDARGTRIFHDEPMGAAISAYRFDG